MTRRLLARRLVLTGCACATLAAALAGCTTTASSGTSVSGGTLSIYVSVPPGTLTPEAQDVLSAEKLAFNQTGGRMGKFSLKLVPFPGTKLSDNAREAIGDSSTIAYLGEIAPGASADTLGITNAQDVLQVSPTDTAVELTQSTPAIANTPNRYYESRSSNGQTFARVVPTTAVEASVVVARMQALGVKRLYAVSDGSEYGRALQHALVSRLGSAITTVSSASGADAVFYAGSSAAGAASLFDQAVTSNQKVALFAPSALAKNSFADSLSPAAQRNLHVSSPGFTAADLPAAGQQFVATFRSRYGHDPATQAVFGYAAMDAVIHALQNAGSSANSRSTVVHDFLAITNFSSPVGTITFDKHGDVSFAGGAPFVFNRVKGGKLIPETPVHQQG